MTKISELQYKLAEAELEIQRHHRDFAAIQAVLDDWESHWFVAAPAPSPYGILQRLRNIVG